MHFIQLVLLMGEDTVQIIYSLFDQRVHFA